MQGDHPAGVAIADNLIDARPFPAQLLQLGDNLRNIAGAGGDRRDEALDLPVQFAAPFAVARLRGAFLAIEALPLVVVCLHRDADPLRAQELFPQSLQNPPLDSGRDDRAMVIARAASPRVGARESLAAVDHHVSTALAALHQTGEQPLRPPLGAKVPSRARGLAITDGVPAGAVDDREMRDGFDLPLVARIDAGDPLASVGVADHRGAVVDELTHVDRVAEDAVAADGVAVDRADVPLAAAGAGHSLGIQAAGDR